MPSLLFDTLQGDAAFQNGRSDSIEYGSCATKTVKSGYGGQQRNTGRILCLSAERWPKNFGEKFRITLTIRTRPPASRVTNSCQLWPVSLPVVPDLSIQSSLLSQNTNQDCLKNRILAELWLPLISPAPDRAAPTSICSWSLHPPFILPHRYQ